MIKGNCKGLKCETIGFGGIYELKWMIIEDFS
jgi:hypothetical protein